MRQHSRLSPSLLAIGALLAWSLAPSAARAEQHRVVRSGETIESIATGLSGPAGAEQIEALAATIRLANGLEEAAQPTIGDVILVPSPLDSGAVPLAQQYGLLVSFHGTGQIVEPGEVSRGLQLGAQLPPGTLVCTDLDSTVTIRLAVSVDHRDHDDITALQNTCVSVDSAGAYTGRRASLVTVSKGTVAVREGFDDDVDGTVIVRTPASVSAGDGGGFRVHIEEETTRTEALSDPVAVYGAGTEVVLDAGQGTRVIAGEAPQEPVDLLMPGSPVLPDDSAQLRFADFEWTAVPRSLGYRVEISLGPSFEELVVVEDVGSTHWYPDYLLVPYRVPGLWWRVSAFDRTGFLGVPSESRQLSFPSGVGP